MSDVPSCRRCGAPVEMRPTWRKAPKLCAACRPTSSAWRHRPAAPFERDNLAAMTHGANVRRLEDEAVVGIVLEILTALKATKEQA